jgi:prepilin-type N-terminal cleavage/methylation domain-containing protein
MPKNIIRSNSGFTLIEALIAMVILTIGILGTMAMQTTSIRGNYRASTMSRASSNASGMLEYLRSMPFNHADLTITGTNPPHIRVDTTTGYTMNWTVALVSGVGDAKLITVTVSRPNNLRPVSYEYIKFRE